MNDIIWGNGGKALSKDSFELHVTHRKDGNKLDYADLEKILITEADVPGLSHNLSEWSLEVLESTIKDAFLKCEVKSKNSEGFFESKVSPPDYIVHCKIKEIKEAVIVSVRYPMVQRP